MWLILIFLITETLFLAYLVFSHPKRARAQQVWNRLEETDRTYIKERLTVYDKCKPRDDEVRMIKDIQYSCGLTEKEALDCVEYCRREELRKIL